MRTHPFDCGPIEAPVTVFLVGIATEDGCFVSGLRKKYEVGHMYPHASSDTLVEIIHNSLAELVCCLGAVCMIMAPPFEILMMEILMIAVKSIKSKRRKWLAI